MSILEIIHKVTFILASLLGVTGSIAALIYNVPKAWILILFMISALLFIATFTSLLLMNPPSNFLKFALIMFCVGSLGAFASALEAFLLDLKNPYIAFLRVSLLGTVFLLLGTLSLMYDILFTKLPKINFIKLILISCGTLSLFSASLLSFFLYSKEGMMMNTIAFGFLLIVSCINIW